ncbi:hypothetical protein KXW98_005303 [Aspergillus fumigatus]|uniref:Uncharacterized protein n=1 Tax=Aspergillus fumigatus TaxID=746128 RepID=A0A8H4HR42_ASPFM|nr:hypothetical protein CNMCM8057_001827 [Aspergillus fumigatus]KAF4280227.1 hypothetical protein CNMCM8689_002307 [Aspergillus fumigatus]KAF4289735.1 hypothetical protein CNMCM8686_002132 [Aspergillus fumigatus]KAH1301289.1 hypothetical protein KXX11_004156 [Aspergillus fumigatus]KAH1314851.1 hypothetical protein KXX47_003751 [Aspergillus fumigatus]
MKRIFGSLSKRSSPSLNSPSEYPDDSPEGTILKAVKDFCESGGQQDNQQGNEFVYLPAIVESAESSPNAAREAAQRLRKYLSDPASTPAQIQYNAIMLMRILIDNPGHTFTRNIDATFVATIKDLLRDGWDLNVQHFLRETLGAIESQRQWDEDLAPLMQMWKKEKSKLSRQNSGSTWRSSRSQHQQQQQQAYPYMQSSAQPASTLPPPDELAARVTEAKTSAKLLLQFVQSTPPTEFNGNELIKEFCTRCQTASRAIQNYIHSTNPAPDENTLQTLIETNDELSVALSKYQHAFLSARKATGNSGSQSPTPSNGAADTGTNRPLPVAPVPQRQGQSASPSVFSPPSPPPRQQQQQQQQSTATVAPLSATSSAAAPVGNNAARYEYRSEDFQVPNPFADDYSTTTTENQQQAGSYQRPTQHTL